MGFLRQKFFVAFCKIKESDNFLNFFCQKHVKKYNYFISFFV